MSRKSEARRKAMLEALRVTEGNIRSLGPAGALGPVYMPYRIWLRVVQEAIAVGEFREKAPE